MDGGIPSSETESSQSPRTIQAETPTAPQDSRALADENKKLKKAIADLQRELQESQESQAFFQAQVMDSRMALADSKKRAESYKEEALTWQKRYEETAKPEPEQVADLNKQLDDYVLKIADYERLIQEWEAARTETPGPSRSSGLESEETNPSTDQQPNIDVLQTLHGEISVLKRQHAEIQSIVKRRENELDQLRHRASSYQRESEAAKLQVGMLKALMDEQKTATESRDTLLQQLTSQHKALVQDSENKNRRFQREIEALKAERRKLEAELREKEKSLERKRTIMDQWDENIRKITAENKQLNEAVERLNKELAETRRLSDLHRNQVAAINKAHSTCHSKIRELSDKVETLSKRSVLTPPKPHGVGSNAASGTSAPVTTTATKMPSRISSMPSVVGPRFPWGPRDTGIRPVYYPPVRPPLLLRVPGAQASFPRTVGSGIPASPSNISTGIGGTTTNTFARRNESSDDVQILLPPPGGQPAKRPAQDDPQSRSPRKMFLKIRKRS